MPYIIDDGLFWVIFTLYQLRLAGFCPSIVVETRPWSAPSFPISPCRLNLHQNFETQGATGNQEAKRGLLTDEEHDLVNLHKFSRSAASEASGSFILAAAVCDYSNIFKNGICSFGFLWKEDMAVGKSEKWRWRPFLTKVGSFWLLLTGGVEWKLDLWCSILCRLRNSKEF